MDSLKVVLIISFAFQAFAQTFDGPAELPRLLIKTTLADTPSPNAPKIVGPSDSLPAALTGAQCGDHFLVDPGNVTLGGLTLPTLACDSQHWIMVENSGLTIIDEFHRIHPGIPMPKIILNASNSSIKGGTFIRLIGFEITRTAGTGIVYNLILPGAGAHDLIFDRDYVHGTATDETTRGLFLSNTQNVAVINSYFSDFHCQAISGACSDAQAIAGGTSSIQDGSYKIDNNYLEASGENFMLGGGPASFVPQDVTVQYNDLIKPDSWNPADPSYFPAIGHDGLPHPWIVKNLIEFKNCRRCLIQGNRMVGSWGGFSQTGFAFLLTPKNQNNNCPSCAVEDVTFRNNWISKTGLAMTLGCAPSDAGGWPAGCGHWSVHDNLFDHLQFSTCFQCGHWLTVLASSYWTTGTPLVLHDVSVNQNSFYVDGWLPPNGPTDGSGHGFLVMGGPPAVNSLGVPQMSNIQWTNNVQYAGHDPIFSTGGGTSNCITGWVNLADKISHCWVGNSAFTGNVIFNQGHIGYPFNNVWPAGNYILTTGEDVNAVQSALSNRKP